MNIIHIHLDSPPDTRNPSSNDDWGDVLTIGLHLIRRKFINFNQGNYGVYLGLNTVGLKTMDFKYRIYEEIKYESSEEMHKEWVLD